MNAAAPSAEPYLPRPWRIVAKAVETPDIVTFTLAPPASGGIGFAPGQFNMLYAFGAGESAISISGDPLDAGRLIHTIRAVGSVTQRLTGLEVGDVMGVRGPYGSAWPVEAALGKDLVIVAGGLGLAPLRPAIYEALRRRPEFRRVVLIYGARSPDGLIFRDEVEGWREVASELRITVDVADESWRGDVGSVLDPIRAATFDPADAVALVCGPEIMMRYGCETLMSRGVPPGRLYVSLERNMKCAIARCGHCQFGPHFMCKDGPVFAYDRVHGLLAVPEI